MEEMDADVAIGIDADFQHDPKHIPEFIKRIEEGNDFVIGSRYTKGGSIPKEWAFYRKFLSYFGNLFSKVVLLSDDGSNTPPLIISSYSKLN